MHHHYHYSQGNPGLPDFQNHQGANNARQRQIKGESSKARLGGCEVDTVVCRGGAKKFFVPL